MRAWATDPKNRDRKRGKAEFSMSSMFLETVASPVETNRSGIQRKSSTIYFGHRGPMNRNTLRPLSIEETVYLERNSQHNFYKEISDRG